MRQNKGHKDAYSIVQKARQEGKNLTHEKIVKNIFSGFYELHGDRINYDDRTIVIGLGKISQISCLIMFTQRGETLEEKQKFHFGSAGPAAYRKAKRGIEFATKFSLPVISFIDTPGALPTVESEYEGQAKVIAEMIRTMIQAPIPSLSIITGEGASGGALALASADRVWMTEDSYYSVVSPEGFATILWKDKSRVKEAANQLELTPAQLQENQVIDRVIDNIDSPASLKSLKQDLLTELQSLTAQKEEHLLRERYQRYRKF